MGELARLPVTGAEKACSDSFVLPAHYAITAALNAMHDAQAIRGTNDHWLWNCASSVASGRLDLEDLAKQIETGPTSRAVMTCRREDSRKVGKPAMDHVLTKLVPDRFRAHRDRTGWGEELQVVVVRKDAIHARSNFVEERSAVSGLAVCRHALERYYERERLSHSEIEARILRDLADVDRRLAFAVASGLFCNGDACSPGAVTVLPLGEGLLIVRNAVILADEGWRPSSRAVRKKRSFFGTPTDIDPQRSLNGLSVDGRSAEGFVMAMGVTYLSERILRLEQRAYAALFRSESGKHDLDAIGCDMGRTWLAHERRPPVPTVNADPYLRYLLSQIVGAGRKWPLWYAMGWTRHEDPLSD